MTQEIYNFDQIKDQVEDAVKQIFPVAERNLTATLESVEIDDRVDTDDLPGQYRAITGGRTWGAPVYANVSLRSPEGEINRGRVRLMTLPKPTSRKTFIVDGQERQLNTVLRRRSGVYTHTNEAGELQSEFNLDNGLHDGGKVSRGRQFKIRFDPDTQKFQAQVGTKKAINAYSLLDILGYDVKSLESQFGKRIHEKNVKGAGKAQDVNKIYESIYGKKGKSKDLSTAEKRKRIEEAFKRTKVDPETTELTLGMRANTIDSKVLTTSMQKLLKVSRGEVDEDDREGLMFKHTALPPQLIAESISHPSNLSAIQGRIRGRLKRPKPGQTKEVQHVVQSKLLDKTIRELFNNSAETNLIDHANPVGAASAYDRVSMLGTGGIKSENQIPVDAPLMSPSHLGFLDPLHTPESSKVGINLHLASSVKSDGRGIKSEMVTPAGETKYISATDAARATVAFADEYDTSKGVPVPKGKKVRVQRQGKIEEVDAKDVDYIVPRPQNAFDSATNLVPFLQSNQGNRAMMAGKHATQAIPLKEREKPLIQTGYENRLSELAGARKSPVDGKVKKVENVDGSYKITIKPKDRGPDKVIHAYRNFPTAGGIILDSDVLVKPGQAVKSGDVLADSTFTKGGELAMGRNLRTAFMPWRGKAFEDGVVISADAAEKLTSIHLHEKSKRVRTPHKNDPDIILDKRRFKDWFQTRIQSREEDHALDDQGLIKPGQTVQPGQLLMAGLKSADVTDTERRQRSKTGLSPYDPKIITWDGDVPGTVTEVKKDGNDVRIFVKTEEPAKEGDKIVGRNANKGIITGVLPTEEMPHTKDGKPVDVIMSPLGIPGRINLGQVLEVAAAKSAEKSGKSLEFEPFKDNDYIGTVRKLLKKDKIDAAEELVDPTRANRSYGEVFTGPQYVMKLEHQVDKKIRARSTGKYDRWDTPQGGDGGAQSLGELGTYTLLAHGAQENLRDMQLYKSQRNDGLWDALLNGKPVPVPKHIKPNDRFEGLLRVAGVKLAKGDSISLTPQTDEDTERLTGGKPPLSDPAAMLKFNHGKVLPEVGGMFDPDLAGGENGTRWTHIESPEPVLNPLFEPAVQSLTGWTKKDLTAISQGEKHIGGETGGAAIRKRLAEIDLDTKQKELKEEAKEIRKSKGTTELKAKRLSGIYKQLRYVDNLKKADKRPEDVYVINKIPVLPPQLRPITALSSNERVGSDINYLYRDLGLVTDTLKESKELGLSDEDLKPLRQALNDGMKALVQAQSSDRPLSGDYRGAIGSIIGKKPSPEGKGEVGDSKRGLFQDNITRRRQDFSGRSTITVEPRLKIDEVGLPFEMAHKLYEPWAIRKYSQKFGVDVRTARKDYQEKGHADAKVRTVLSEVGTERPVLVKRDPSLHKFNVMSFFPKLVEGKAIQLHPLMTSGFNADFDGDQMSVYVPLKDEAVEEAKTMVPSKNLFSPANAKIVHSLGHEMVWGLNKITEVGDKTNKKFGTVKAARNAWMKGKIKATDRIKIQDRETTVGWEEVNNRLPSRFRIKGSLDERKPLTGKAANGLLSDIARKNPEKFAESADSLKNLGNEYATDSGLSFDLDDFDVVDKDFRDRLFAKARKDVERGGSPTDVYGKTIIDLDEHNRDLLRSGKVKNNLFNVVESGSRGSWDQFKQIVSSPVMVYDAHNRVVPRLLEKSYSEGLNMADYWTSAHGARKGAINKSVSTARPGYLSKQIMRTVLDQRITTDDCGTRQGVYMSTSDPETQGRYLVQGVRVGDDKGSRRRRTIKRNTLLDSSTTGALKANKVNSVLARSPTRCEAPEGICAKCAGLQEDGNLPSIGTNIGVLSAQSIGEPSTQLSLNVFHKGGIVEDPTKDVEGSRLEKVEHLLRLTSKIPGSAVLAPKSGPIESVEPAEQGGFDIDIGGRHTYVPQNRKFLSGIKKGTMVERGKPLTEGLIHPMEVLKLNGAYAAQDSLVDQLHGLFVDAKGVKKRHFETVVRGMTNYTQVMDEKDSKYRPGESAPLTHVKRYNASVPKDKRVRHLPMIKGVSQAPLVTEDWVSRLNADNLRDTLINAANQGWKSDTKGSHPIPSLTFLGVERLGENTGFGRPVRSAAETTDAS